MRSVAVIALLGVACANRDVEPPVPSARAATSEPAPAPPAPPPYGPEVRSLSLRRSIAVRFGPDADSKDIGTVEADTRVTWRSAATGPGCDRWIEIEPRGWVCDRYLEPSTRPPTGKVFPVLEPDELVPGTYGKVAGTGVTVRKMGEIVERGRTFWKTSTSGKIDARRIVLDSPSTFAGVWLAGRPLPIAWAQSRKDMRAALTVRVGADPKGRAVAQLAPRTVIDVLETRGAFARIGDDRWVAAADLHVARANDPPADVREEAERWLDVNLDEQVVVAYEGKTPVFATLVSTGNKKWPTAAGIYRIWLKFDETDMNGQMGDEQPYSVATVPWTMFFARDLAFHTAYWHDRFGEARSHGCVNLSPSDARALFEWASPDSPLGWSMAHGYVERPGSLVRIHGSDAPADEYKGYAKVVHERQSSARL